MSAELERDKRISENVAKVRSRVAAASSKSGRAANEVKLVAVTKYVDLDDTRAVIAAGCTELGESRPQSLWDKGASLTTDAIHWHLIGHLQRNKVRRTLPLAALIHSVDSERLLKEIDEQGAELAIKTRVLLEINVSGDEAKDGLQPTEVPPLLERCGSFRYVSVEGLMAMSGLESDDQQTRREFALLRELRNRWQLTCPPNVELQELSMGMSGDFEIAIEEGATLVRVGSILFEGLDK